MSLLIFYYILSRFAFMQCLIERIRSRFEERFILTPFLMQIKRLLEREFEDERAYTDALQRVFTLQRWFLHIHRRFMVTIACTPADDRLDAEYYTIQIHHVGAFKKTNFCASVTATPKISKKRRSAKPAVLGIVPTPEMEG